MPQTPFGFRLPTSGVAGGVGRRPSPFMAGGPTGKAAGGAYGGLFNRQQTVPTSQGGAASRPSPVAQAPRQTAPSSPIQGLRQAAPSATMQQPSPMQQPSLGGTVETGPTAPTTPSAPMLGLAQAEPIAPGDIPPDRAGLYRPGLGIRNPPSLAAVLAGIRY